MTLPARLVGGRFQSTPIEVYALPADAHTKTADQLAEHLGLSQRQTMRVMRKAGISPSQHRVSPEKRARIVQLLEEQLPPSWIAADTGEKNEHHRAHPPVPADEAGPRLDPRPVADHE